MAHPYRMLALAALAAAAAAPALPVHAQGINAGQCIVAGRLNEDSRWAPRFSNVELLGPKGRVIRESRREALNDVRQVRVIEPALLTKCDDDREVPIGEETPIPKEPVPAIGRGVVDVDGVAFPKLRRGGELVELRLRFAPERVVMVKR